MVGDKGKHGVSISPSNVRGLRKNLAEVKILNEHTNLVILTISETHLTQDVHNDEVNIDGYQILRKDRAHKAGGGVAIYFKSSLDCTRLSKYDDEDIETSWIKLLSHSQTFLIGCVCRPPELSFFFDKFHRILDKVWMTRRNIVIAGDFNSDLLTPTGNGTKLKHILRSH